MLSPKLDKSDITINNTNTNTNKLVDSLDNYSTLLSPMKHQTATATDRKVSSKFVRAGSDEQKSIKKSETKKAVGSYKQNNISSTKDKKTYSKQSIEKIQKKEIIVNSSSTHNVSNISKGAEVSRFSQKSSINTGASTPMLKKNKI
jgi:hypothetical protein